LVKFQRLQEIFPNQYRRFNILYLGSSSLPADSAGLLRLARRRGAAIVWNQNGVAYPAWAGDRVDAINGPMRLGLRTADHVFFQSDFCRRSAETFLGPPAGPAEVLHNAVDTSTFVPAPRPGRRPLTLLLGGDQLQSYRLESALRALALVRADRCDARLLVTGLVSWPGADNASAHSRLLARELGVEHAVEWLGSYAQSQAPALMQRADVLLHTKVNDPCPNVVIEALACGLPVVYADSGGVPELVGPDAGRGVPVRADWQVEEPPDPAFLAAAVAVVAADLGEYGRAARERAVERFGFPAWVERHRRVFGDLIA
jgi:glycosyltransferase involved in cell wall biosynthesis